jgi:hypothetical protein
MRYDTRLGKYDGKPRPGGVRATLCVSSQVNIFVILLDARHSKVWEKHVSNGSKPFARRPVQNFVLKSNIFLGKLVTFLLMVLILLPHY